MVEGLEGRQLLSGLSAGKASVVADVQKVREAGITIHGVEDVQAARRSARLLNVYDPAITIHGLPFGFTRWHANA
jgi:hypothetical protein